ncbi:MAG: acetyl-CoA acetyltransferase [Chloroflexaceae bacterium]|nr:acetyl-CoA acetyltransferase [Chloroflexaceae bacterium]
MTHVYITGIGATAVGEHYTRSLADLVLDAFGQALANLPSALDPQRIGALYIANAHGAMLAGQANMGAAVADIVGLNGIEALTVEAAGASGGMAVRQAALAIRSGAADLVAVVGIEKVTDKLDPTQEASVALALDSDFEAEHGLTRTAQWALLMRRYMHEYGYAAEAFAPFPVNAHANAASNKGAMYRFPISADKYRTAGQVASPLNMLDCASLADGAAVLLLASEAMAQELGGVPIRIAGSAVATDTLALYDRPDPLWLAAVERSATAAMQQAGVAHRTINVLEVTDPHGVAAALALEASGFVGRGAALRHAADGGITLAGSTPLATAGGYKARGDIGGASGVYQVLEIARQLRGVSGVAPVEGARIGFAQSVGGVGTTAVTHILVRE